MVNKLTELIVDYVHILVRHKWFGYSLGLRQVRKEG